MFRTHMLRLVSKLKTMMSPGGTMTKMALLTYLWVA